MYQRCFDNASRCLSLVKRHGFHVLHLAMIQNGSLDITFMTMKPS